ncbi:MAG: hypothetical protein WBL63_03920 [Candidatus Acidiferrum sp.]
MRQLLVLSRRPRVLILSASSGAGHVRAGQALEQAFLARGGCHEHLDALAHVSKRSTVSTTMLTSQRYATRPATMARPGAACAIVEDALGLLN